jgi:2-polyprenyl-6-methoxyphenol hydroxylase-like FAD-dependent oxidoreductase
MAAGFPTATIEFLSGTGRLLGRMPIGGTLPDGTMTHTIKRADLYRILYEETRRRDIRIEHGKRLVAAESTPRGVVARFADGTSATGDLLIGADGIHSRTRRIIAPAASAARYTGLGNIGGFTRTSIVPSTAGAYGMIFGKLTFFGYTVSPSGEIWWFANPGSAWELSREELAAMTSDRWKARLLDLFSGDAGPASHIIRSTTGMVLGTNQYDMPKVPTWSRGPMVIIGDAAHAASPSSGQGASMAIEDALVLAQCLRDVPDTARALAAFEQIRRPRVERVVAFGARSSSHKAPGPLGRVVRDLALPMILKIFARTSQDWLYGYQIDWEARVGLRQAA